MHNASIIRMRIHRLLICGRQYCNAVATVIRIIGSFFCDGFDGLAVGIVTQFQWFFRFDTYMQSRSSSAKLSNCRVIKLCHGAQARWY
jgi:hypothetical protein